MKRFAPTIILIAIVTLCKSATITSIATGSWTSTSTWSTGTVPTSSDDVIVAAGHTVTMNGNTGSCLSLTISGVCSWSQNRTTNVGTGGLIMNAGSTMVGPNGGQSGTLNVSGNFTVNSGGTSTVGDIALTITGATTVNGTLLFNSTQGVKAFSSVTLASGSVWQSASSETEDVSGNFTMNGATISGTSTCRLNVGGDLIVASGSNSMGACRLVVTGTFSVSASYTLTSTTSSKTIGNITITSTGSFDNSINETWAVSGNFQNDGSFTSGTGTFTFSGASKTFSGASTSTFNGTLSCTGTYTNNGIVSIQSALSGAGTWTQGNGTLDVGCTNGNFSVTGFDASGSGNTVIYSRAANQNVRNGTGSTYHHLTLSGSNTKSLVAATTCNGNVTINSGSTFDVTATNYALNVKGNWTNNGTFTQRTGTVTMNGTSSQTMGGTVATTFNNLTINNSSGITLSAVNPTINAALTFTSGVITTGSNKVIIAAGGTVSGAATSRFVNGSLQKNVATGTNVSRTFEVGNGSSDYLPVTLLFASVSVAGNITVTANNGDHANIGTSCIDAAKSVNRNWTIANSGVTFTSYSATCTFIGVGSDADAGSTASNYFMTLYSGSAWTLLTQGTVTSTTNQATGITAVGDLQIGEKRQIIITTQPSAASVCSNAAASFSLTVNGANLSYQWQENNGGGFVNMSNTGVYSGVTTATLSISSAALTMNGYQYRCIVSTTCGTSSVTSSAVALTVTSNVTASVSISASATTICSGTSVTFTATPTNGGTSPSYQWKVNGTNVGTNSVNYTSTSLANGNTVTCQMTSNATCVNGSPATSNNIVMTVNPNLVVSVSISASAATICPGTSVTFTATPTNGGTTPSYQWKLNGTNVGTNSVNYTNSSLVNGDVITCQLTSNATCATGNPATSNNITMTVNPNLAVSVSISASATTICPGTSVTFTATPTNGGTTPSYQWKLNGTNVGSNSVNYTNSSLANGDVVTCQLTSNATCTTGNPATSNSITMTVNPNLTVSVSISASATSVCGGTTVTFTATPTNGGTTPSYQWKLNGTNVGSNSVNYSNSSLANGDVVTCQLTSNATCATGNPATSNSITMTITSGLWQGTVSTDWNNAANWCGGIPSSTIDVTIPASTPFAPALTAAANCKSISVASGVTVDLAGNTLNIYGTLSGTGIFKGSSASSIYFQSGGGAPGTLYMDITGTGSTDALNSLTLDRTGSTLTLGTALRITNVLNVLNGTVSSGGNLTLAASSSSTGRIAQLNASSSVTGNVTVEQYSPGGTTGWTYWGTPITSALTFSAWDDDLGISCAACPDGFPGSFISIYGYDETVSGAYDAAGSYIGITSIGNTITPGKGYWVYFGNGQTTTTAITMDVTGTVRQQSYTIPLSYTNTGSSDDDGWNLISNPYPSPIRWSLLKGSTTNIDDAIYVYNPDLNGGAGTHATYVNGVSSPAVGSGGIGDTIPSCQGFYVHSTGATSLSALESNKTAGSPSFLRVTNNPQINNSVAMLRLKMTGPSNYKDETVIYEQSGANSSFDGAYDAIKMAANDPLAPWIALEENGKTYQINGVAPFSNNFSMDVRTMTGYTGAYTISPENIQSFVPGACITLFDRFTNTTTNLRTSAYSFTLHDTTTVPRFQLNITVNPLSVSSSVTNPSCTSLSGGNIIISGTNAGPWNYFWYNSSGTLIQTNLNKNGADTLSNLSGGTYSVNVSTAGNCDNNSSTFTLNVPVQTTSAFSVSADTVSISNATVQFTNNSYNAVSYLWNFGGSNTDTQSDPNFTFPAAGNYLVTLITSSADGCTDSSSAVIVVENLTLGNQYQQLEEQITLSSLSTDEFYISAHSELNAPVNLIVSDEQGRRLLMESSKFSEKKLDMSAYASGIYFISLQSAGFSKVFKISVSH